MQTSKNIYVFIPVDNKLQKVAVALSENVPNIKLHTSIANINTGYSGSANHVDGYTFYIASEIAPTKGKFFSKKKYEISKMNIYKNQEISAEQVVNTPLFEHDTPIMHVSKIKKYVVGGSLFPTIKIYDPDKEEVIGSLYNRFLLGTIKETLVYARKEEKERRKTAFTRWLYADTNKKYNCTLHTLANSFDTKNEKSTHISIEIDKDNYPLTCKNSSSLIVLDQKENFIHIVKSGYQPIQSILAEPLIVKLGESKDQRKIENPTAFKKYVKEIFGDDNFAHYIKSQITHENYKLFLEDRDYKDHYDNDNFFHWLMKKILNKVIKNENIAQEVANEINKEYGNALYSKKISGTFFQEINLDNLTIYPILQQHFTPEILHSIHEKSFAHLFYSKNMQVSVPVFINSEKAKNISANDSSLFLQTDQALWQLDFKTEKIKPIYQIKDQGNSIENIFAAENGLYMITNKELIKIELSQK